MQGTLRAVSRLAHGTRVLHRVNELRRSRRGSVLTRSTPLISCFALALSLFATACSGSQSGGEQALRPLPEARALDVIEEAFRSQNLTVQRGRVVTLRNGRTLTLDVGISGSDYGVEFFHDQDRRSAGPSALPTRTQEDTLLTAACSAPDGTRVEVLVLHDHEYVYEPNPDRAGGERPSMIEVEDRLRRTVIDYVAHLRSQALLR